jgi:hypothetical protein
MGVHWLTNLMVDAVFIPKGAAACGVFQRGRPAHLTPRKDGDYHISGGVERRHAKRDRPDLRNPTGDG